MHCPNRPLVIVVLALTLLMAGCGNKDLLPSYVGPVYPPTSDVEVIFQYTQAPESCRVFTRALLFLPAGYDGAGIAATVTGEAARRGADMVLVGNTREAEKNKQALFIYYPVDQEYNCRQDWSGWKFGYDTWKDLGQWVSMGVREWGNPRVSYEKPLVIQMAFLRCR
ncbi:hypothetical protein [Desulfolithobacter sp.]